MAKKRPAPQHITMSNDWIACLHCGAREVVFPGGRLALTPKALKAWRLLVEDFQGRHAGCPRTPESPLDKVEDSPEAWERGLFAGTSSATIFRVMMGRWPVSYGPEAGVPRGAGDFGRCHRLLRVVPAWRERLVEVGECYPEWAPLVAAWDALTGLFEAGDAAGLYRRLGELGVDD